MNAMNAIDSELCNQTASTTINVMSDAINAIDTELCYHTASTTINVH